MSLPLPGVASYRLQFHAGFRFADALELLPYLGDLGISHVYASPITRAASGSNHGYDVCDPTMVNPELGNEADLLALLQAVRAAGLGWIQDVVPNHLAASPENPYWMELLTYGRAARWRGLFDIDWEHPDLDGRIQLPVLAEPYATTLATGGFRVELTEHGAFLCHNDLRLPLNPASVATALHGFAGGAKVAAALRKSVGKRASDTRAVARAWQLAWTQPHRQALADWAAGLTSAELDRLLVAQAWRVVWWRAGREMIGYRRFFAVDSLAAVRVDQPEVFELMHGLVLRLADRGLLSALRIDHIDGLRDPAGYLDRLRARLPDLDVLVEKILVGAEPLPRPWPVAGTSGYDFLAAVGPACGSRAGDVQLAQLHTELVRTAEDPRHQATRLREHVDDLGLAGDLDRVVRAIRGTREVVPEVRDLGPRALRSAVAALVGRFPVYRTYGNCEDAPWLAAAWARALEERPELAIPLQAVHSVLRWGLDPLAPPAVRESLLRFEQFSGPVMAKGCEDTFFYTFTRWLAYNEVGGQPLQAHLATPDDFLRRMGERGRDWPGTLNATATHDTKRGEDTRARLIAITWQVDLWSDFIRAWWPATAGAVHVEDGYALLQTIIGAWPDEGSDETYRKRVYAYARKHLREAKVRSSWSDPDEAYEAAVEGWLQQVLEDNAFTTAAMNLVQRLRPATEAVSLAQTILKCCLPGMPDIYQGCEWPDFSLVDPDNRRPVDFSVRRQALAQILATATLPGPGNPARKQAVLQRCLTARRANPDLWNLGTLTPWALPGAPAGRFAWQSRFGLEEACVVIDAGGAPASDPVPLPILPSGRSWQDIFTGRMLPGGISISWSQLCASLPGAVLVSRPV